MSDGKWFFGRGHRRVGLAIAVLAAMLAGCAVNQTVTREMSDFFQKHQQELPDRAERYARTPTTQPAGHSEVPDSLREFILLALTENPDIKRAEQIVRAKAQRVAQVTALPDPVLSTKTLPEPIRTAEGDNFFIMGIRQKLIVPEKLDRAGRIALEETRIAMSQLEQIRVRVIADVKRSYFQLYIIDKTIVITEENRGLVRGLIDVARGQMISGRRAQEDVLRAQVELSTLDARLITLRQRRQSSQAMLNTVLDRKPDTPIPTPGTFDVRKVRLDVKTLFDRAVVVNPQLKRFQQQIERDREGARLARLAYWPEFTVGFEWIPMKPRKAFQPPRNPQTGKRPTVSRMSEAGTDNWAIIFGLNLPIWYDKIRAGIRESEYRLAASIKAHHSSRNRVHFRIEDALARVAAQEELATLFKTTIIPQARQAYEVSRAGYVAGTSDFQNLIDNWEKWLTFTIQYHRAIGELERNVADLEQAVGVSLSEAEKSNE